MSYVAVFIVSYQLVFWVFGAAHSLSWDYLPGIPQGQDAEVHLRWSEKPVASLLRRVARTFQRRSSWFSRNRCEQTVGDDDPRGETGTVLDELNTPDFGGLEASPDVLSTSRDSGLDLNRDTPSEVVGRSSSKKGGMSRLLRTLLSLLTPVTISLFVSLPIALVQPLKALFVDSPAAESFHWKAPDGRPPLAFVIDTGRAFVIEGRCG